VAATRAERPPRHLAAGASINVAAQVATIAAAGITSVAVARLLGPSGTGTLALAVTLVAVSTTLFSVGLRSGVIYRVSRGTWAPHAAARAAAISALALGTVGGLIGLGFYALTSGSVLQGLRVIQVVARIVIEHLLGFTRSGHIVFHGGLIKVLLVVGELKQQRNRSGVPYEMERIDIAGGL